MITGDRSDSYCTSLVRGGKGTFVVEVLIEGEVNTP
jgi:hypothetical protein